MIETKVTTKLNFLSGGGEMGERIRHFDWNKTPLGHPEGWESSLKTCVRIMLTSPQPMFVWYGDDLINIYNDAYKHVMGGKHPSMLGVSGNIVWKEIWDELWERVTTVFEKNEGTFDEALLLIMNRYGYDEETYFKFSYNPIPGTIKTTAGLFCVCTEETQRIINERALDTLRKLGAIVFTEKSLDIIYRHVTDALAHNNRDFPFALVYKLAGEANTVSVAASTGIDKDQQVFPDTIDITKPTELTKEICEAFRENKTVVSEIKAEYITLPTGAWETPPKQIIHLPVSVVGSEHPYCIISAALNPYRKVDEEYLQFCQLIADRVSIEINKMLALEIESKRAEALAEIDRAKIVFFSNISHEFRTPLTLMLSPLEEILSQKNNNLNASERQNIEIAQRNAMRLLKLVNTLLDFSNIEKGRHQATFSLVDLGALTKNLTANFRAVIEKAGLNLMVNTESNLQPVYVDKQMWEKIVFNLLSNAFKYTLDGSITVTLSAETDFAVLQVIDTGVGIPESELPKMFDRFHRIQNVAGRTYEGTGIGLSLVKELVQMHHGRIQVESTLNKGSVFTVSIPLGRDHLSVHHIAKSENGAAEMVSDIYVSEIETLLESEEIDAFQTTAINEIPVPTILVVEDNADMREHIRSLLSNRFNVITANNGMDALHKLKESLPALVLSDIMMPVMDGIGLLKEIKMNKATAHIPVIFLTARAGEESTVEGWESGADDYLVKPFSSRELKARIDMQLKITRKRERALQELYSLFDKLPFAIVALSGEELCIEFVNQFTLNVWQHKREDVIGKPLFEVRPDIKEFAEPIHKKIYRTGKPYSVSEIAIPKNNAGQMETHYYNISIDPMFDEGGKMVGQVATSSDVTEQVLERKKIEVREAKLQLITDALPMLIGYIDKNRYYHFNNKAYEAWFGHSSRDISGKHMKEVLGDGVYQQLNPKIDQVLRGKSVHFEMALPSSDGGTRWVVVDYMPHFGDDNEVLGFYSVVNDVTATKIAEELNLKLASIVQSSADAIISKTLEGIVTSWNCSAEKIFGYTAEEMIGKSITRIIPADRMEEEPHIIKEISQGRSVDHFDTKRLTKEGKLLDISLTISPIKDSEGKIIGASKIARDITDMIEVRRKVEESEKQFNILANNIQNLAWIADGDGSVYWYNQRWYDYTGTTLEEMKGWGWQKVHHPDLVERITEISKTLWITNEPFELTYPLRRHDGEYRWFLTRGVPINDENGNIVSWIGTNTDIEEQKNFSEQLEEKVRERTRQLNEVNEDLEEKNIELQKMNQELEAFTYISSHDLQEPLRKIQTFAGRIITKERDQLSETAIDYFSRMQDAATRMQALINDLLSFSRLNTYERILEITDLHQIIEEVVTEFNEVIEEKNAVIIAGEMYDINIIPFQFRQLMYNLIGNALKFSKQDVPPRIHIQCEFVSGSSSPFGSREAWHISVGDNGIGFEKHFGERIFGVFQKLHAKEDYAGTGIGLAIVKKIVDNHNGIISAESELGEGTTFNIYLPVTGK